MPQYADASKNGRAGGRITPDEESSCKKQSIQMDEVVLTEASVIDVNLLIKSRFNKNDCK